MRALLEMLIEGLLSTLVTTHNQPSTKTYSAALCRGLIWFLAAFVCLLIGCYVYNPNLTMAQIGLLAFWCLLFGLVMALWFAFYLWLSRRFK